VLRVGLTGGIACGKSGVLRRLAAAGLAVIDLDTLAHAVTAPGGSAYGDVVSTFGNEILTRDGHIDRRQLGERIFGDEKSRHTLNAIVHPRVRAEEARLVLALAETADVVVTDGALLVESGIHLRFDRLVVVHCAPDQQLARLMARDGIDVAAAVSRISAQLPLQEKRRFAHFELDTSGSREATERAADQLALDLRSVPEGRAPAKPARTRALGSLLRGPARGPRGLTPERVLQDLIACSGPELARLAGLLEPPSSGPWYRAATAGVSGPSPATLMAPLVLWALAHKAPDPPFLCAAAASLARLTHLDRQSIADACAQALALQQALVSGSLDPDDGDGEWARLVERWAGVPPSPGARSAVEAARRGGGEAGGLGAMLAGALAGAAEPEAPRELVAALSALGL
jgi:dephospho-CoA kinase